MGDYLAHSSRMSAEPPSLLQGLTVGSQFNLDTTCYFKGHVFLFPSVCDPLSQSKELHAESPAVTVGTDTQHT